MLISFCRAGNLSALLKDDAVPDTLKPYIRRLAALYENPEAVPKRLSNTTMKPLNNQILHMLVKCLNEADDGCEWMAPNSWAVLSKEEAIGRSPVQAQAIYHQKILHKDVLYSTFQTNQNNSFVACNTIENAPRIFGRISCIFQHRRSPSPGKHIFDNWVYLQCFPPLPKGLNNPFSRLKSPNLQAYLRSWSPTKDRLVKLEDIQAHCVWIMYPPGEIHKDLQISTVALVVMQR